MAKINSEQFRKLCDGVWSDRIGLLAGRGVVSGEIALLRAVYWRLCKGGVELTGKAENYTSRNSVLTYQLAVGCMLELNARPHFDGAPFLKELVDRYQNEVTQNC